MQENSKLVFVTGTIAYKALERVIKTLPCSCEVEVKVLSCTVAALMTTEYIARKLGQTDDLSGEETIIIPGLCEGNLQNIERATGCKVVRGPKDMRDLPKFIDKDFEISPMEPLEPPTIKILGEIVNASKLTLPEILNLAEEYRGKGADIIDLGGDVGEPFPRLKEVIRALKGEGFQVSIDSHQRSDILNANEAGVDFVLSLTSKNIELAQELNCVPVIIPDHGEDLAFLYRNIEKMEAWGKKYIVDPILPPLTMGVVAGLERYAQVRRDFPEVPLLMGLGNVTELVDADSPGVVAAFMGMAAELQVNYILTTEVAYRARGVIKEVQRARGLMHQAISLGQIPKYLDDSLLVIKEPMGNSFKEAELHEMQKVIKDKNYRIFVDDRIYVFNSEVFLGAKTAKEIFTQLNLKDISHAFYLGSELNKAELALTLGKKYVQDTPLRWGYIDEQELNIKERVFEDL